MFLGRKRPLHSNSITQTRIIDTKSQLNEQRSKEVMSIFMQQTELTPVEHSLPEAKLKKDANLSVYETSTLSKYSDDIQLIWSLVVAFSQPDQVTSVKKWIYDLINPGLESQLKRSEEIYVNDPFASTFVNLTFGQYDAASENAQAQDDFNLAMYIIHSEYKDVVEVVQQQIAAFKKSGQWQTMTVFHKKCWHVIAGNLGYVHEDGFVVTEGVYWQRVLGMYIWFGNRFGCFDLNKYNNALDTTIPSIHQLKTVKHTAAPDDRCYWYQLMQWWIGDAKVANLDDWPLDLVWLLTLYKQPNSIDKKYTLNWIDYLERQDMAELAIYATLFVPSPLEKVNYILRQCEWNNEAKLINSYFIPKEKVYVAKALNAHDCWDYENEYRFLLEGGLHHQAKMALFFFLLPKTFDNNEKALSKSVQFLADYPHPDTEVATLTNAYNLLLSKETSSQLDTEQCLQELGSLQAKYPSRSLDILLQDLRESLTDKING